MKKEFREFVKEVREFKKIVRRIQKQERRHLGTYYMSNLDERIEVDEEVYKDLFYLLERIRARFGEKYSTEEVEVVVSNVFEETEEYEEPYWWEISPIGELWSRVHDRGEPEATKRLEFDVVEYFLDETRKLGKVIVYFVMRQEDDSCRLDVYYEVHDLGE